MNARTLKFAIWIAAGAAVYFLVTKAKAGGVNADMGGVDFGVNGAFSQDSWDQEFQ